MDDDDDSDMGAGALFAFIGTLTVVLDSYSCRLDVASHRWTFMTD